VWLSHLTDGKLSKPSRQTLDLILMDVQMPDFDGYQPNQDIRAERCTVAESHCCVDGERYVPRSRALLGRVAAMAKLCPEAAPLLELTFL
jgi:CheY-like chemotaxis protein